jgi:hypothetical protein
MKKQTLSEVFAKLTSRLTTLELYNEVIDYDYGVPVFSYSIKEIETAIFNYPPKEAIKRVDICLKKILNLQNQKEAIIGAVTVEQYNEEADEHFLVTADKEQEVKKELYESIQTELLFYESKLSILRESLELNSLLESNSRSKKLQQLSILPDELALDMRQFALLFNYLREYKVIQPLKNDRLASYLSLLTGFESKIRTTKGLGAIPKIKSDKVVNKTKKGETEHYNLITVKQLLQKIINVIDSDIKAENK